MTCGCLTCAAACSAAAATACTEVLCCALKPQMVDERSSDGTPERLRQLGIRMLQPPERQGVTHNWNMVRWPRAADCMKINVKPLLKIHSHGL